MSSPLPQSAKLGRAFQADAQSDETVQMMVGLLDLQDAAPSMRRLRDWALGAADVQPGHRVVDVGSGTGTMARELADLVGPTGQVTGIEPNSKLRTIATERAARQPDPPASGNRGSISFVEGLATRLPLPDHSVDLVWCERVMQHLADPQGAMNEFARVLRPGGRALVLDSDHASRVTSDVDFAVEAKITAAFFAMTPNPRAARHIPRQAIEAGFTVDPDVGSAALVMMAIPPGAPSLLEVSARQAVAAGTLSAEEAQQAIDRQRAAAAAGHGFSAVTVFGFSLRLAEPTE